MMTSSTRLLLLHPLISYYLSTPSLVVLIVVTNGLIKPDSPGSLIEPAATYLFPANWLTLPLSFGLLMSPWGGHSVFPNVSVSRNAGSATYRSQTADTWQFATDLPRHASSLQVQASTQSDILVHG